MKTKNMRKKALLSSVAMLLVAVVALGGATYAWFTTSTNVTATGIKLETAAQSNLQIQSYAATPSDSAWSNTIALSTAQDAPTTLTPMSSANGTKFFEVGIATPDATEVPNPDNGDFLVNGITDQGAATTYEFLVRDQKGGNGVNLKIGAITPPTNYSSTLWNGLRVAVFVAPLGETLVKKLVNNPAGSIPNDKPYVISASTYNATGDARIKLSDLYGKTQAAQDANVTLVQPTYNALSTVLVENMQANQAYHIKVAFWLEGNATDNTAVGQTINGMQISLTTGS